MDYLAEHQVPIEICLSSNLRTGCCPSPNAHPLPEYIRRGMLVTLNTDDPEMFETTLNHEFELAAGTYNLSNQQLTKLSEGSLRARFSG